MENYNDLKNVRNTRGMKQILAEKFKAENCYFTMKDISISKYKNGYKIIIKEYEFNPFYLSFADDDYFGHMVLIDDEAEKANIIFVDSKYQYDVTTALIELGYYIANRF